MSHGCQDREHRDRPCVHGNTLWHHRPEELLNSTGRIDY